MSNKNLADSIISYLNGDGELKRKSPLLRIYFFSWIFFNWHILYYLLFFNGRCEEEICTNKYQYFLTNYHSGFWNLIEIYGLPIFFTYSIIYLLPKISIKTLQKYNKDKVLEFESNAKKEKKKEELRAEILDLQLRNLNTKDKLSSEQEEKWFNEYQYVITDHNIKSEFSDVIHIIYNGNGYLNQRISDYTIAKLTANELINKNGNKFTFNNKGNFFAKAFINDGNLREIDSAF